jgi:hypothetical protein
MACHVIDRGFKSRLSRKEAKKQGWGVGGALVGLWGGYGGAIAPHLRALSPRSKHKSKKKKRKIARNQTNSFFSTV